MDCAASRCLVHIQSFERKMNMSKELESLLTASEKGVKDFDQIQTILQNLLNAKAYTIIHPQPGKQMALDHIFECCNVKPENYTSLSFAEVIMLLKHPERFEALCTPDENGESDFYLYTNFLTTCIILDLMKQTNASPEIADFLNINFYKFMQFISKEISHNKMNQAARLSSIIMDKLFIIYASGQPDNNDTLKDVFKRIAKSFYLPLFLGIERPADYLLRMYSICEVARCLLIISLHDAFTLGTKLSIDDVMHKHCFGIYEEEIPADDYKVIEFAQEMMNVKREDI